MKLNFRILFFFGIIFITTLYCSPVNAETIIPLCQAGIPFDASFYAQNTPHSEPMVFTCYWNGTGRVYISGNQSALVGIYADDGYTISVQPSGTVFDAPEHYAHRHPVVELTSGMRPRFNTITLVVRNWQGLSMSYGSEKGTGIDQTPSIVQMISTPEPELTPTTGVVNGGFENDFAGWTQAGWTIDASHGSAGAGSKSATVHGSSGPAYMAQSAFISAPSTIRFWYSRHGLTTGDLIVYLDGTEVRRYAGQGGGSDKWVLDEIAVTSSGTHTLTFSVLGYSYWTNIDDITVVAGAAPEVTATPVPTREPLSPFTAISGLVFAGLAFVLVKES